MIKLIVAYDKNKLIGHKNVLPWSIKEELEHFKNTTMGSTLLMGRVTFENLPSKLKNRKMIVLSSKNVKEADTTIHTEKELNFLLNKYKDSTENIWIAGGKSIYEKYYTKASELIISEIKGEYKGDVKLDIDLSNWERQKISDHAQFTVYSYKKKTI